MAIDFRVPAANWKLAIRRGEVVDMNCSTIAYGSSTYRVNASITNTVRYTAMSPEPFKDIWR